MTGPFAVGDRVAFGLAQHMVRGTVVRVSPKGHSVIVREDGAAPNQRGYERRFRKVPRNSGWFLAVSEASWATPWKLHMEAA